MYRKIPSSRAHTTLVQAKARAPTASNDLSKHLEALQQGAYAAPGIRVMQRELAGLGLVTSKRLQAGDVVLALPEQNSLRVPESSSIEEWTAAWLFPFQAVHGELPPALVTYISDRSAPALHRLAALILHCRRHSSSKLWKAWLVLLPSLADATFPGGPWTPTQLQQLQLEPLMLLMAANHADYMNQAQQLFEVLADDPQGLGLKQLGLADSVSDCQWALFVAATRGSDAGSGDSSIHALHDIINHGDDCSCKAGVSDDQPGFFVVAARDVDPGAELTLAYTRPRGLSSLEVLLSWGFTPPTRPTDWLFDLRVHTLPLLPWNHTINAAVQVAAQMHAEHSSSGGCGEWLQAAAAQQHMLLAVLASLPLQLPAPANGGAASAPASFVSYQHAAGVLAQFGLDSEQQQQLSLTQQAAASRFRQPGDTGDLRLQVQDAALQEIVMRVGGQLNSSSSGGSGSGNGSGPAGRRQQLLLQARCAAALQLDCQIQLLQCGTTIQEDELLLQQLQSSQLQQVAPAEGAARPKGRPAKAKGFAAATQKQQQHLPTGQQAATSAAAASATDQQEQQYNEALQQLQQLQRQVLALLLLSRADALLSSSSGADDSAAARLVAGVVVQHAAVTGRDLQEQLQRITQLQQQQAALVQLLEQQQHHQQRQVAAEASGSARFTAAVAARLERKRLLQLGSNVCGALAAVLGS